MKVISGILKGRNIIGYNIDGTRPTMDRVKESIFAMIGVNVRESIVLDLFAGTGNYGIEALSNYAKFVYFNDYNKKCTKVIKENLEKFNILDKAKILNMDYKKCLTFLKEEKREFDLVFLDPPYKLNVIDEIMTILEKNNLLKINSYVIVEMTYDNLKEKYNNLVRIKKRKYGEKIVYIYKNMGDLDEFE